MWQPLSDFGSWIAQQSKWGHGNDRNSDLERSSHRDGTDGRRGDPCVEHHLLDRQDDRQRVTHDDTGGVFLWLLLLVRWRRRNLSSLR